MSPARRIWFWFQGRTFLTQLAVIALGLYGLGYLLGTLGFGSAARELGNAGLFVGSILLLLLVVRHIWTHHRSNYVKK